MTVIEAQRKLLGAMLISHRTIAVVARSGVSAAHFTTTAHSALFEAIVSAAASHSRPVDAVDVGAFLIEHDRMDDVGGASAIAIILESVARTDDISTIISRVLLSR